MFQTSLLGVYISSHIYQWTTAGNLSDIQGSITITKMLSHLSGGNCEYGIHHHPGCQMFSLRTINLSDIQGSITITKMLSHLSGGNCEYGIHHHPGCQMFSLRTINNSACNLIMITHFFLPILSCVNLPFFFACTVKEKKMTHHCDILYVIDISNSNLVKKVVY